MKRWAISKQILRNIAGCCAMVTVIAGYAQAGGLYLNEFGTPSMGVAGAGAQAVAKDASTSFHNPAGMTRIKDKELMGSAGFLYYDLKFDPAPDTPIPGGDGGDAGGPGPILGGFYVHSLSDRWKIGANVISISAALIDYDDDWAGRYLIQDVTIFTLTFNPTIAYRVTDWLSVGGGLMLMYGKLEETLAAPPPNGTGQVEIDGDDVEFGFDVGALFEFSERTRLGIVYASKLEPTFGGDVSIKPVGIEAGIDATITFPQTIRAGIYHDLNDRWALLGSAGWENWSDFENITISTSRGTKVLPRNWDDTWYISAGVHYRISEPWLLQLGFKYDSSPVDAEDRTPDAPVDRQIRIATGVQYQWSDRLSIGGEFTYANFGEAKIDNDLLKGKYDRNQALFFALNFNWKF